ncbi:hypothetical protein FDECE_2228 [Fusarium decemcellulare]|nr:hypothetical protein FDECE_2228 [Fusarium decemcellulare]
MCEIRRSIYTCGHEVAQTRTCEAKNKPTWKNLFSKKHRCPGVVQGERTVATWCPVCTEAAYSRLHAGAEASVRSETRSRTTATRAAHRPANVRPEPVQQDRTHRERTVRPAPQPRPQPKDQSYSLYGSCPFNHNVVPTEQHSTTNPTPRQVSGQPDEPSSEAQRPLTLQRRPATRVPPGLPNPVTQRFAVGEAWRRAEEGEYSHPERLSLRPAVRVPPGHPTPATRHRTAENESPPNASSSHRGQPTVRFAPDFHSPLPRRNPMAPTWVDPGGEPPPSPPSPPSPLSSGSPLSPLFPPSPVSSPDESARRH